MGVGQKNVFLGFFSDLVMGVGKEQLAPVSMCRMRMPKYSPPKLTQIEAGLTFFTLSARPSGISIGGNQERRA